MIGAAVLNEYSEKGDIVVIYFFSSTRSFEGRVVRVW